MINATLAATITNKMENIGEVFVNGQEIPFIGTNYFIFRKDVAPLNFIAKLYTIPEKTLGRKEHVFCTDYKFSDIETKLELDIYKKQPLVIFRKDDMTVYLPANQYLYFKKVLDNPEFRFLCPRSPVLIVKQEKLIGIIFPVIF